MKYLIGFLAGLAAAWSALAIWRRWPGIDEDIAPEDVPPVKPHQTTNVLDIENGWPTYDR